MSAEHDEIQDSLAPFLFGASGAAEAEMVRAHIDGCTECQQLGGRLLRAIDTLPLAVETVQPPARLRERILSAAAVSRQSTRSRPRRTRILRLPHPGLRSGRPAMARAGIVAAAAVVAFALGAGLGVGIGRSVVPQSPPAETVAQFTLAGTGPMSGAQGRVYELKPNGLTLVQFSGLPQPEQGHVYQMWLIPVSGQPASAGVFVPDANGGQVVVVTRGLQGFKEMAVTQELGPAGAAAPSEAPHLLGPIGQ